MNILINFMAPLCKVGPVKLPDLNPDLIHMQLLLLLLLVVLLLLQSIKDHIQSPRRHSWKRCKAQLHQPPPLMFKFFKKTSLVPAN